MIEAPWLVVAFGSNIDPARNLPTALTELRDRVEIESVSSIYRTPAVGAPGTPDFWNAAARVRSELPPGRFKLQILRPIEERLGRERGDDPNAPRTIDLDLVIWSGGPVADEEAGLRLPDPGLGEHPHLTVPVAEVVPEWRHPASGRTLSELAGRFAGRAARVSATGWSAGDPR